MPVEWFLNRPSKGLAMIHVLVSQDNTVSMSQVAARTLAASERLPLREPPSLTRRGKAV